MIVVMQGLPVTYRIICGKVVNRMEPEFQLIVGVVGVASIKANLSSGVSSKRTEIEPPSSSDSPP